MLRVISGKVRGLKLDTPKNEDVRPTTDRVKESLFNIINPYIIDSNVLDLFAGTGSLGIECLSRGASSAIFVDVSKESINIVKSNIKKARVENESTILNLDFKNAIDRLKIQNKKFDIIMLMKKRQVRKKLKAKFYKIFNIIVKKYNNYLLRNLLETMDYLQKNTTYDVKYVYREFGNMYDAYLRDLSNDDDEIHI